MRRGAAALVVALASVLAVLMSAVTARDKPVKIRMVNIVATLHEIELVLLHRIMLPHSSGETTGGSERISTSTNASFADQGDLDTGFSGRCGRTQASDSCADYQHIRSNDLHLSSPWQPADAAQTPWLNRLLNAFSDHSAF